MKSRWTLLVESLRLDAKVATRGFAINSVAASPLVPRILRYAIYRSLGLQIRTPNVFPGCRIASRDLRIGTGTFVNVGCMFEAVGPIRIGKDCQIAMQVLFVTSHHPLTEVGISKKALGLPITVGDRCWIGARAVLLPGVTIGDDCVIAAGAVVTGDCLDNGVYAGVPAKWVRGFDQRTP